MKLTNLLRACALLALVFVMAGDADAKLFGRLRGGDCCCETTCCDDGGFLTGLRDHFGGDDCCCEVETCCEAEPACGCEAAPVVEDCGCVEAAPVVEDCGCAEAAPCCEAETCCEESIEIGSRLKGHLGGLRCRICG